MCETTEYVGLYASFPIKRNERKVGILERLLSLEDVSLYKRISYGQLMDKPRIVPFKEGVLREVLEAIPSGDVDYVDILPYWRNKDALDTTRHSSITWQSRISEPRKRPLSPVEIRFGNAGRIEIEYPISRFEVAGESDFQRELMKTLKEAFVEFGFNYALVHQGRWPIGRPEFRLDDDGLYLATRNSYPLTYFTIDLSVAKRFYKERIKGAFWANFLNPLHVEALGGLKRISQERPCRVVEELGGGCLLLQVAPSPLDEDASEVEEYQRLRRFLRPIMLESQNEVMEFQASILGDWKPP